VVLSPLGTLLLLVQSDSEHEADRSYYDVTFALAVLPGRTFRPHG
jgi:hypothetical protein